MVKAAQYEFTTHHITSTTGVYKYILPSRLYQGTVRDIAAPTPASYSRQIKVRTDKLQSMANELWRAICDETKLGDVVKRYFLSYSTHLPSLYILLKTHKFDASTIIETEGIIDSCKVRPIVSCCNSPTEKLAWLVTHLLTPLLDPIPTHLKNTHQHLHSEVTVLTTTTTCKQVILQ